MAEGPAFSHDGCGTSPPAIDIVLPVHLVDTDWKRDRVARLFHVPVDVVVIADEPADLPIQLRLEGEVAIDAHEVPEQRPGAGRRCGVSVADGGRGDARRRGQEYGGSGKAILSHRFHAGRV